MTIITMNGEPTTTSAIEERDVKRTKYGASARLTFQARVFVTVNIQSITVRKEIGSSRSTCSTSRVNLDSYSVRK
jgi:hypothetical protein